jgi:hypothetical protein
VMQNRNDGGIFLPRSSRDEIQLEVDFKIELRPAPIARA